MGHDLKWLKELSGIDLKICGSELELGTPFLGLTVIACEPRLWGFRRNAENETGPRKRHSRKH